MLRAWRDGPLALTLSVIEGVIANAWPIRIVGLRRWNPSRRGASICERCGDGTHYSHNGPQAPDRAKTPSRRPKTLVSCAFCRQAGGSITIVMRSDVANFSMTFSGSSTRIIVPSRWCSGVTEAGGPLTTSVALLQLGYEIDCRDHKDRNAVTLAADARLASRRRC
jgi:hypothetical protein